jgi:hypothetical protein
LGITLHAQLRVDAPSTVVVGERFQLRYTANTQDVSSIKLPELKGFDVLFGPSTSRSSSISIINGKQTSSSSTTMTYMLMANNTGTYTIPAATAEVDGKTVRSSSVTIKVISSGSGSQGNGSSQGSNQGNSRSGTNTQGSAANGVSNKDIFMSAIVSKKKVYEQEAILLTYKLFWGDRVQIDDLSKINLPDMTDFHVQEIKSSSVTPTLQQVNGRNYYSAPILQYVLFPQRSGKLTIPSIPVELILTTISSRKAIDPIEAFFNGGSVMEQQQFKKTIQAPATTIDVKALPQPQPANFSGAVGHFSLNSSINLRKLKTDDPVTVKMVVTGSGNIKLIKAPTVEFPKDFETYDVKVTDNAKVSTAGVSGSKTFEYMAVPRNPGDFTIPASEFVYFDPSTGKYKTLSTESYALEVEKGAGGSSASNYSKEDLQVLANDIRYIKTGTPSIIPVGNYLFGSMKYWLTYLILFVLFVVALVYGRKVLSEHADVDFMRGKSANKVAKKRLRSVEKLLKAQNKELFYTELLKTLWGYVGDKLVLPTADLNKENVSEKLQAHAIDEATIEKLLRLLNDCEFAQYAPSDSEETSMQGLYDRSADLIGTIENTYKK